MVCCPMCRNEINDTGVQYVERVEYSCVNCKAKFSISRHDFEIFFFRLIRSFQEEKPIEGMKLIRQTFDSDLRFAKDAYHRMHKDYQLLSASDPKKD